MRNWLGGFTEPPRDKLISLAQTASVSVEWLATGKGSVFQEDAQQPSLTDIDSQIVMIPRRDVLVSVGSMGDINEIDASGYRPFSTSEINRYGPAVSLHVIEIRGEGMAPTLAPGDDILINTTPLHGALPDGIYLVRMGNTLQVKRLQLLPGEMVRVISDNPAYLPFDAKLDTSEIVVIGLVVWVGRHI